MVRLQLVAEASRLSCYGIVDSGADWCIFPFSFALQLGLDPLQAKANAVGGVGSMANTVYHWDMVLDFGLFALNSRVGFTQGLDAWGVGLLGQIGFLDQVKVELDYRGGSFYIEYP